VVTELQRATTLDWSSSDAAERQTLQHNVQHNYWRNSIYTSHCTYDR